ncbi:very short patch repair endonuclease [Stenotrophomonas rhizophila]
MTDVLTPHQRRLNMSRIRGRDTKPEMIIRLGLHAMGFRYRLQDRSLPGRPDLVFPRYGAALFVHGCFWHGHDCALFKMPETRRDFWERKIASNRLRDQQSEAYLLEQGWRVATVWECSLKGRERIGANTVLKRCASFLHSNTPASLHLRGQERANDVC